jgi:DNA-binding MarR family transcriptional regulator
MKNQHQIIHGKFQSLMALAQKLEKMPKTFGTGQKLSHSKIHLIEIIGDNPDLGVTDIAALIGVTKGAVSQSLKRLEKKGLSQKFQDPKNLSRAIVCLTAKGKAAYWAHKHWHETMDGGFARYLAALDETDMQVILDFLSRVEDFLIRRLDHPE